MGVVAYSSNRLARRCFNEDPALRPRQDQSSITWEELATMNPLNSVRGAITTGVVLAVIAHRS